MDGKRNVLATLCHQREAAFALLGPIPADVGVRKVPVADGLEVLRIHELTECPRPHNFGYGAGVWRIPQNW